MNYPQLPIFAFFSAFLVLIPFSWHWRARNIATISIIFWLFLVDVIYGINAIIWAGNVANPVPAWCDITSKLVVGANYALPLATICVCKHLEAVSSSRKVQFDSRDRRNRMIFEIVMCFVLPVIFMGLHYIVQGHRFDIVEDLGCQATLYISVPAILLVWFPPLLFSVITAIYAAMALHHFIQRRLVFAAHLQNSNSSLNTNRYMRLIAMAVTEMTWGATITALNLWNNVYPGLRPWTNWADVHSNFSRVDLFPAITIPPDFLSRMLLFWATMPASSLIFFLFFGFGEEAKKEYGKVWAWIRLHIFRRPDLLSSSKSSFGQFKKMAGSSVFTRSEPKTPTTPSSTGTGKSKLRQLTLPTLFSRNSTQVSTPSWMRIDFLKPKPHLPIQQPITSTMQASVGSLPPWAPSTPSLRSNFSVFARDFVMDISPRPAVDVQKSASAHSLASPASTAPPAYTIQLPSEPSSPSASSASEGHNATASSSSHPSPQQSNSSLRTLNTYHSRNLSQVEQLMVTDPRPYDQRIYVSDALYPTRRTPSPPPFHAFHYPSSSQSHHSVVTEEDVDVEDRPQSPPIPEYHRPFTPPNSYPLSQPHPGNGGKSRQLMDAIRVEVERSKSDANDSGSTRAI